VRYVALAVYLLLCGLLAFVLVMAVAMVVRANECTPEPASPWAPAGWICPPAYGEGTAST
jgi:hypothetical protein